MWDVKRKEPPHQVDAAIMVLVGLLAAATPARRALRVQPTEAAKRVGAATRCNVWSLAGGEGTEI
jgi:hypothetical protein